MAPSQTSSFWTDLCILVHRQREPKYKRRREVKVRGDNKTAKGKLNNSIDRQAYVSVDSRKTEDFP
jgi:hypothetical protein